MSATETVFDTNDRRPTANAVGQIENGAEAIRFFARLGYDVDDAAPVAHSTLGLETDNLQLEIKQIRRIAAGPDLGDIVVYLMQVRAATVTLVQAITRRFRTRPELALLLLTTDCATLDFVLLDLSKERADRPGQAFRQVLRPRTLTVSRRKPTVICVNRSIAEL